MLGVVKLAGLSSRGTFPRGIGSNRHWNGGSPGVMITKEQYVPAWHPEIPRPARTPLDARRRRELAKLDIRARNDQGRMINVDIGFADPFTIDEAELRRRARAPGRAAEAYV